MRQESFGHIGWGYRDRAEFLRVATEFMADGLARNQAVQYVGEGGREDLLAELAQVMPELEGNPHIRVTPISEFYGSFGDGVLDPEVAVAATVDTVAQAVGEGYTGLRAVADDTALVRDPADRSAFARYEFLMDRAMVGLPIFGMCGYDVSVLGTGAAELVCLHPTVGDTAPRFRLRAAPGASFALEGEIDAADAPVFRSALHDVWPLLGRGDVRIDVADLDYVDHNELLLLELCARRDGATVVLQGAGPVVRRLVDLMKPANVRLEPAA